MVFNKIGPLLSNGKGITRNQLLRDIGEAFFHQWSWKLYKEHLNEKVSYADRRYGNLGRPGPRQALLS